MKRVLSHADYYSTFLETCQESFFDPLVAGGIFAHSQGTPGDNMESNNNSAFREDVKKVITSIKTSFGELLRSIDVGLYHPKDVYNALGIDKKLGWKIYNVTCEEDHYLAAQHVPGINACRRFFKKCRKNGASKSFIASARSSIDEFELLVERHAGSRQEFDLMLLSCSEKGRSRAYLSQQKAAFNAYSHLLGAQASIQLCSWFFAPSSKSETHDIVSVRGFVDFRRNRPNVPWLLEWAYFTDDDGKPKSLVQVEPLEKRDDESENIMGVPFYYRFSSDPLPDVLSSRKRDGHIVHELEDAPIGNTESITCLTAQIAREVFHRYRTKEDRYRELVVRARTPVEKLFFDQIVHVDLLGPYEPELFIFGEFTGYGWADSAEFRNPHSRLPIDATIRMLGHGSSAAYTPQIPWYTEMLEDVFRRLNWDPDKFRIYRTVIDYPVIPSTINMRSLLPEKEGENS